MDNKELNNSQQENPSAELKDYEIEKTEKKNFFSSLLDKLKNRNQKLLNSGNHTKTQITNSSISSLWGIGNIKSSLFTTFDNISKAISSVLKINSTKQNPNALAPEIIGENSKTKENEITKNPSPQNELIHPIIPIAKSAQQPKGIIDNAKTAKEVRIEVASIDTSAINKKDEKKLNENLSTETKESNVSPSIESTTQNMPDER